MKQDDYNENELKRMEDELRSFGTPYSSNEPDDRYWANFRVRLNEKIDGREAAKQRSVFATIAEWFTASAFRGVAVGATAIIVIVGSIVLFSSKNTPVVATNETVAPAPIMPQVSVPNPPATGAAKQVTPAAPAVKHSPQMAQASVKKNVKEASSEEVMADEASDPSKYDPTLSPGKADEPVDYSTLSEAELRSVLADINTISH
jgi:hypothetical protein